MLASVPNWKFFVFVFNISFNELFRLHQIVHDAKWQILGEKTTTQELKVLQSRSEIEKHYFPRLNGAANSQCDPKMYKNPDFKQKQ